MAAAAYVLLSGLSLRSRHGAFETAGMSCAGIAIPKVGSSAARSSHRTGRKGGGMSDCIFLIFALFLYFVSAIIALDRKLLNFGSIFIVNLFFGWTLIGWVGTLAWALAGTAQPNPHLLECPKLFRVIPHLPACGLQIRDTVAAAQRCGYFCFALPVVTCVEYGG